LNAVDFHKLDKKQLRIMQQMQAVDTMKQVAVPLVNNPAMQLLAFCVAVEALQKIEFDFKRTVVVPTLDGNKYVKLRDPQPLINNNLGVVLEGSAMLSSLITHLGKSKVITRLIITSPAG